MKVITECRAIFHISGHLINLEVFASVKLHALDIWMMRKRASHVNRTAALQ